jgi:cysteine-rich repeat protein
MANWPWSDRAHVDGAEYLARGCLQRGAVWASVLATFVACSACSEPERSGTAEDAAAPLPDDEPPPRYADAPPPWFGTDGSGPPQTACGNGVVEPEAGEACDDGNRLSGDGCSSDCKQVECFDEESYFDPISQHCYWRDRRVTSRTEAIARCAERGGYLFRWSTFGERDQVYRATLQSVGGRVWIGLQSRSGTWTWDDGKPADPSMLPWGSREPSGDGPCVEWRQAGDLNDIPCTENRDFVCEREPPGRLPL